MEETGNMKSIVATYPEFHSLPKGIKQLLVNSETLFFQDARSLSAITRQPARNLWASPNPVVPPSPDYAAHSKSVSLLG
jgi:hypothetical protein